MNRRQRQDKDLGVRELLIKIQRVDEQTRTADLLFTSDLLKKLKERPTPTVLSFHKLALTPDIGKGGLPSKRRVLLPYRTCRSKSSIVFATCFPNSSNIIV